jgi:hypothetical protein
LLRTPRKYGSGAEPPRFGKSSFYLRIHKQAGNTVLDTKKACPEGIPAEQKENLREAPYVFSDAIIEKTGC